MGLFFLTTEAGGREQQAQVEAALLAGGFLTAWRHHEGELRISLCRKLNGGGGLLVKGDNGDFAIATGTLIYRGQTGTAALKSFLDAFAPGETLWRGTQGIWSAVLRKEGRVYLVNDQLNSDKIYCDAGQRVFSNSFIALCEAGKAGAGSVDDQGSYEYVWNGAAFGTKTFFSGIRSLPNNTVAVVDGGNTKLLHIGHGYRLEPMPRGIPPDSVAEACNAKLKRLFSIYSAKWPRNVRSALSGGYDSRLLLALLLDSGMQPALFVYGNTEARDVQVAKEICTGEGLAISHIDKQRHAPAPVDAFRGIIDANVIAFDGWKYDGLFDGGIDLADRLARSKNGAPLMNGSVGEVFRNFFYLRDTPYSIRQLVHTFYSRYSPKACTARFDRDAYEETVVADIAHAIGAPARGLLPRQAIEMVYPLFRGRYWTARDAAINQRFGTALYPFLEPTIFDGTWNIPFGLKNLGRLEARMIARLAPRLAQYPSDYGFAFSSDPPWRYRATMEINNWRPAALRKFSYRLQHRQPQHRPYYLQRAYLSKVIDTGFPYMRRLFNIRWLHEAEAFNRVCTIEYLCQRYGVG